MEEDIDSCPVDCDAVMDSIMSSDVAFELEADGSISVPLEEFPFILHLGISPSQILHVIQDGRLSVRSTILNSADSAQGDLWDNDSGLAISYEGCENDSDGHLVHDDHDAFPACCETTDKLDGLPDNDDMTSEMEALLSAQFSKDKPEWGEELSRDCPSAEECSSLGSIEDILVRAHSSSDVLEGMLDDLNSLAGARSSCHDDVTQVQTMCVAYEDDVPSLFQGDLPGQDNSIGALVNDDVAKLERDQENLPLPHNDQHNDGKCMDTDTGIHLKVRTKVCMEDRNV